MTRKSHPAASARIVTGAGTTIAFIVMVTGFQVSATLVQRQADADAAFAHNQSVVDESSLTILMPESALTPAAQTTVVATSTSENATTAPAAPAPVAAPAPAAQAPVAPAPPAPAPAAAPAAAPASAPADATTAGSGG